MSEVITPVGGLVEAVIISGPRRGEIVNVDLDRQETLTPREVDALHDALARLDRAFSNLVTETRELNQAVRTATQEI